MPDLTYDVVAVQFPIVYTHDGDHDPDGLLFTLRAYVPLLGGPGPAGRTTTGSCPACTSAPSTCSSSWTACGATSGCCARLDPGNPLLCTG